MVFCDFEDMCFSWTNFFSFLCGLIWSFIRYCYGLCPFKIHILKSNPQVDGIRRLEMIRALIKKAHKAPLPLIPCDNTARGYCEPESEHLPETECASTWSYTSYPPYLLYISHPVYGILPELKQRRISGFIYFFGGGRERS